MFFIRRTIVLLIALTAIIFLAGCSGLKPYRNNYAPNLSVKTTTDSGSFFSNVKAAVDIHWVDDKCQTRYQGTIDLNAPHVSIGIPYGRTSYLVFVFSSSSFLANTSRSTTFETLLKPAAGHTYDIGVSYLDDIYNVEILEKHKSGKTKREVLPASLKTCSSLRH